MVRNLSSFQLPYLELSQALGIKYPCRGEETLESKEESSLNVENQTQVLSNSAYEQSGGTLLKMYNC